MYGVFILPKGEASEDRFGKQLFVDILGGGSVGIFESNPFDCKVIIT
jgi:hypothetical protein